MGRVKIPFNIEFSYLDIDTELNPKFRNSQFYPNCNMSVPQIPLKLSVPFALAKSLFFVTYFC